MVDGDASSDRAGPRVETGWFKTNSAFAAVYGAFSLIGIAISIGLGRLIDRFSEPGEAIPILWRVLIVVGASGVYFAAYWCISRRLCGSSIARKSQYQDSYYFLGFTLTLAALGSSLAKVGETAGVEKGEDPFIARLPEIITDSAIAISTTVIGLLIRNALAYAFPDGDESGLDETAKQVSRLKESTAGLATEMSRMADGLREISERKEVLKGFWKEFEERVITTGAAVKEAVDQIKFEPEDLNQRWERLRQVSDAATASLADFVQTTTKAQNNIVHIAVATRAISGVAAGALDSTLEHITDATRSLEEANTDARRAAWETTKVLGDAKQSMKIFSLLDPEAHVRRSQSKIDAIGRAVSELEAIVGGDGAGEVGPFDRGADPTAESRLARLLGVLETSVDELRTEVDDYQNAINGSTP